MKGTTLFGIMRGIDPQLIEKAAPSIEQQKTKIHRRWLKGGAMAACFCFIVASAFVVPNWFKDDPVIPDPPGTNMPRFENEEDEWSSLSCFSWMIPPRSNQEAGAFQKRFTTIIVDETYHTYTQGVVVEEHYIGQQIGTVTVKAFWTAEEWGYDPTPIEGTVETVKANVYRLDGVDTSLAVAVMYTEEADALTTTHYYICVNREYTAESLQELWKKSNASQYLTASPLAHGSPFAWGKKNKDGSISKTHYLLSDADAEIGKSILLSAEGNLIKKSELASHSVKLSNSQQQLRGSVKLFNTLTNLHVTDNGYLLVGDTLYYVGETTTNEFFKVAKRGTMVETNSSAVTEETMATVATKTTE